MDRYFALGKIASTRSHDSFFEELKTKFGYLHDKTEMDRIGLNLQVVWKKSLPMYLHGYVLTSALHNYIMENKPSSMCIFETGTARGFSALMMAIILKKMDVSGLVHTLDLAPHHKCSFNNCLKSAELNRNVSREECMREWEDDVEEYIRFYSGDSRQTMKKIELDRIHFAFLDGHHEYDYVKEELTFVKERQEEGDVIVCDDYTASQYPGICRAIDDFIAENIYTASFFYGDDGTKKRGYVYLIKN